MIKTFRELVKSNITTGHYTTKGEVTHHTPTSNYVKTNNICLHQVSTHNFKPFSGKPVISNKTNIITSIMRNKTRTYPRILP
jgi:D-tyrosyl-tRNA(Tyr) deacylase